MKISLKMWRGLFLAAMMGWMGAVLGASAAAADSPGDLESAFREMKNRVSAPKPKPAPPLAAPEEEWQVLMIKIREKGVYVFSDSDQPPSTFGFEHKSSSETVDHVANYVNVWGGVGDDSLFRPDFVTMISEDWKLAKDGSWHIDCWRFMADLYGRVSSASHEKLVKDPTGTMLPQGKWLRPQPAAVKAKYEALLKFWLSFQPAAKEESK